MGIPAASFVLGDHFDEFAQRKVEEGSFGSVSEVVRAGLQLLEQEDRKLEALRAAIQEGLDSGPPEPFDVEEFLAERRLRG